ncbi:MAG: lipo-like protein [Salaquimonas sp.]|nr:lipo-like protein [Salaquimonas sp.]
MTGVDSWTDRLGHRLVGLLTKQVSGYEPYTPSDYDTLWATLQPGDILLVEGNQFISSTIKYLTNSTWSHAAFYVGHALPRLPGGGERPRLIEANIGEGCIAVPLSRYATYNTRICRPVGLTDEDRKRIVDFMVSKLGTKYDLSNIFDLLRYFFPIPVPSRLRRRMIALGSGDPTRAICSSLIAQAFQSVGYPILPEITHAPGRAHADSRYSRAEIMHIRHHSLFTPRDFDLSPYFKVIKPTIEHGFDYRKINWSGKVSEIDVLRERASREKAAGKEDEDR